MAKTFDGADRQNTGPTTRTPPPRAEAALQEIIRRYTKAGKRIPSVFPHSIHEAALYWMRHQEPESQRDRPEWIWKTGSDAGGEWLTPYVDRVVETLHKFLGLPPAQQEFVIQNINAGYPYRGDSIKFYQEVIKQTKIRDEHVKQHGRGADGLLPRAYTAEITKAARQLVAKITGASGVLR